MYDDGPGGENEDCTTPTSPGCWGHRDNILANTNSFGNPTEMDAGAGTDSGGSTDYAAIFVDNPKVTPPGNIVFTWAQEQPFLGSTTSPIPTVSKVSPNSGPTGGGTAITITGTGFVAGATVVVGQGSGSVTGVIPATNVTVVSPTEITAVTGKGAKAGTWSVFVTTSGGTSAGNSAANFTYTVAPTVSKVLPNSGPTGGGTAITITGTGFVAGATVVVGQGSGSVTGVIPATNVTVVSPTEITAVTGKGAKAGTWSVFVTTTGGTSAGNSGANFAYTAPAVVPTVSKVTPNTGPTTGGTAITITGTGFVAGASVVIGQGSGSVTGVIPASSVTVVSPTEITAVTGSGAKTGTWSVFVTTTGGTSAGNAGANFSYH